jgi:RNA polymerase sigma factor (sigma-70 family)
LDEEHLISLMKCRDFEAFRRLVNLYRDKVYNVSLSLLHDPDDAEDNCQEVFIEVFQSIENFRGKSSLFSWIYRITVHKSLETIRKKTRKKRSGIILSIFGKEDLVADITSSTFYHPGVKLENKERAAILFKAISKLPETQRTAFILHKTENLSYADIAEIMQVSIASVESLMFRAKQNLRKLLSVYYEKNER